MHLRGILFFILTSKMTWYEAEQNQKNGDDIGSNHHRILSDTLHIERSVLFDNFQAVQR